MPTDTKDKGLSRRDFARTVLGGTIAAALTSAAASAQALTPPELPLNDETAATTIRVVAQYGTRLSTAQRARLPEIIREHTAMLAPIRALAQPNAAPPATVLRLVVAKRNRL